MVTANKQNRFRLFRRLFSWLLLSGVACFLLFMLWIKLAFPLYFEYSEVETNAGYLEKSPPLPPTFLKTTERVYPGIFRSGFLSTRIYQLFGLGDDHQPIPSECFFADHIFHRKDGKSISGYERMIFYERIESVIPQKRFYEYVCSRADFLHNVIGVEAASRYHFGKPLEKLSQEEQVVLIILMENPAYYDPVKCPEHLRERIKELGYE